MKTGANMQVAIHFQDEKASRWLKRNSTHFVRIILPRQTSDKVFRLTRYDQA